jgi:hypothetical protein
LAVSKTERAALEKLSEGVPGKIMGSAIRAWVAERPQGFTGLKFPVGKMLDELPDYITAAVAAAAAPPPGEYIFTPEEIAAQQLREAQSYGFPTVEEWKAWFEGINQRIAEETLAEEIMQAQGLPEQGE